MHNLRRFTTVLKFLIKFNLDNRYTNLIDNIYSSAAINLLLQDDTDSIPIKKEVRQGDTISLKLFTVNLNEIFRNLGWSTKGKNIDDENFDHLDLSTTLY